MAALQILPPFRNGNMKYPYSAMLLGEFVPTIVSLPMHHVVCLFWNQEPNNVRVGLPKLFASRMLLLWMSSVEIYSNKLQYKAVPLQFNLSAHKHANSCSYTILYYKSSNLVALFGYQR